MTFSGHTWFLFIITVPLGKHRAEHCVLECLFTTTISRPKNVLFWRHLRPCLNRTPGFVASLNFIVFSFLFYISFPYIRVLKVSVHPKNVWRFGDHLIWKVIVLYCMIYGITLVCSTTCQLNICIYIQNPYSLSTICLHFAYTYFWIISPHILFVTALVFARSFENSI